jgi:hypothetical protein
MRWWRSDQSDAAQSSGASGTGSNWATNWISSAFTGSRSTAGNGSARFVPSASTRPGSESAINESVIICRASRVEVRCSADAKAPNSATAGLRTALHQFPADGNTDMSARTPSSSCVTNGAFSLDGLLLQPRLLVEADLETCEHAELRMRLRVGLGALLLVVHERLAQQPLTVRRLTGAESLEEPLERLVLLEPARELEPDLGEHLEVAARDRVAGAADRVEGSVQLCGQAADSRLGLKQAESQQPPPQRLERLQQQAPLR